MEQNKVAIFHPMSEPRRRPPKPASAPRTAMVRKGSVRIPADVAVRVRAGHPWVFRDALGGRDPHEPAGALLEVVDPTGAFVGRALFDPDGSIALRVFTRRREQ